MEQGDRVRLAKLLARTDSEHDGEALAAVRKANELLHRRRLSWSEVVAPAAPASRANPAPPSQAGAQPWPEDPLGGGFFRRDDGAAAAPEPAESGIAVFAALAGGLLAFPLRRAAAYREAFRGAPSPRRRLAIALAAPLAVAGWVAVCWAPPAAVLAFVGEAALPRPAPPATNLVAAPLTPAELAALDRRVLACWHQPEASRRLDMRATVLIAMNRDATVHAAVLAGDPGNDPVARGFAASAVAAVNDRRCQPFPLPRDRYAAWQRLRLTFVSRRPPPAR